MPDYPPPHPPQQAVRPLKFRQRARTTAAELAARPGVKTNLARHVLQPRPLKRHKVSS